jgi:hypothetical protein
MAIALKSSARVTGLRAETLFAMRVAEGVFEDRNLGLMTITSCADGKHSPGSRHYTGGAFDIRTRDIPQDEWQIVAGDIRERLGSEFDVVVEKDHLHIELDPKTPVNA